MIWMLPKWFCELPCPSRPAISPFSSWGTNWHPSNKNMLPKEWELLTVKWAIEHLHYYLWGPFIMVTNHTPLRWLHSMKDTNSWLTWWHLALQSYKFHIRCCCGYHHINADFYQEAINDYLDECATLKWGKCLNLPRTLLWNVWYSHRRPKEEPGGKGHYPWCLSWL